MSYDTKTGMLEFGGKQMYSTRNYDPREYQLQKVKAQNIAKVMWGDFMRQAHIAKVKCLVSQGHEADEPMFAIEKNEEYYPEFKTCVKDSLTSFMANRASAREQNDKLFHYDINEDKVDEAVDRGLDQIKLNELRESDINIYAAVREELRSKYGGAAAADEDE